MDLMRTRRKVAKNHGDFFAENQLLRGERRTDVWEDLEDLVEPGDLENMLDAFLNAGERELAAVFLNFLHAFNEDRETGTVEVSDFGKIDNHDFRLLGNHRTQQFRDLRRNVEVNLAFKRQNIWLFF